MHIQHYLLAILRLFSIAYVQAHMWLLAPYSGYIRHPVLPVFHPELFERIVFSSFILSLWERGTPCLNTSPLPVAEVVEASAVCSVRRLAIKFYHTIRDLSNVV